MVLQRRDRGFYPLFIPAPVRVGSPFILGPSASCPHPGSLPLDLLRAYPATPSIIVPLSLSAGSFRRPPCSEILLSLRFWQPPCSEVFAQNSPISPLGFWIPWWVSGPPWNSPITPLGFWIPRWVSGLPWGS